MYQKSPFPYLITLIVIVGLSCFTNLTIDKEIEEPIIHVIKQNSSNDLIFTQQQLKTEDLNTELAVID